MEDKVESTCGLYIPHSVVIASDECIRLMTDDKENMLKM
jgi:hypothetical protein